MTGIKRPLLNLLKWLLIIELGYLLLINVALQLPLTQTLINQVRPEKFQVAWENAWTWYPFRVHADSVTASGQSRSQQWQVDVTSASGTINPLPLVLKRVILSNVSATDIAYKQRPRLKPDKDYSALLPYFPDIEGWEIAPADTSPRKTKRPWKLTIDNASASGVHKIWIFNINGGGSGELDVDLSFETRGGPFSLDARNVNLSLDPAYLNGQAQVFHHGTLSGSIAFAPFVPRENKGIKMLPFLKLDTLLDLEVENLKFINLFTANLGDFFIDGAGRVSGELKYDQGFLLANTGLAVAARDLEIRFRDMHVAGEGSVRIHTPANADKPAGLDVDYNRLQITRQGDEKHFLQGDGLKLRYTGSNFVIPDTNFDFEAMLNDEAARERRKDNTLKIQIEEATLVDMTIANDYLPEASSITVTGGTAKLTADVFAEAENMTGGLQLTSADLELEADQQALEANLDLDLVVAGGVPRKMRLDLSGSRLTLDEVSVAGNEDSFDEEYWSAVLNFDRLEGKVRRPMQLDSDVRVRISDTRPLVAIFQNQKSPPRWISGLLTLKDIEGEASVNVNQDLIIIPQANIISDEAEVAAKVAFTPDNRTGMIYARYKKLDVLLKLMGQEQNMDIIKVREKFDRYELKY